MPIYSGTIKSVTGGPSVTAFLLEWGNPDPPPAMLTKSFASIPAWVRELVAPNLGKSATVSTDGGTPETITTVTVSA